MIDEVMAEDEARMSAFLSAQLTASTLLSLS